MERKLAWQFLSLEEYYRMYWSFIKGQMCEDLISQEKRILLDLESKGK